MKHKQLISRKLEELQNLVNVQNSMVSQLRPPQELKDHLDKIKDRIQAIEILVNAEQETF